MLRGSASIDRAPGVTPAVASMIVSQMSWVIASGIGAGRSGRIGVQGAGEVRGLDHDTGLGIEFHLDLDLVTGHDTGGFRFSLLRPSR